MSAKAIPKKALTRKEAAEAYSVSEATLRRAERTGTLRAKSIGGSPRYRVEDLDEWFSQLEDI